MELKHWKFYEFTHSFGYNYLPDLRHTKPMALQKSRYLD